MKKIIVSDLIDHAAKQYDDKFVGSPTNRPMFDFDFKQPKFHKIEKSNLTTINPIK